MSAPAVTDPLTVLADLVREVGELRTRVVEPEPEQEHQAPKRWLTAGSRAGRLFRARAGAP